MSSSTGTHVSGAEKIVGSAMPRVMSKYIELVNEAKPIAEGNGDKKRDRHYVLLYGLEACPINSSDYTSLEHPVAMAFLKVFKAIVAVSVEALVFIIIGRSCSEGCGFDFHCRPGSFLIFNSRPIMYCAVGSLVLGWSWTRHPGFISFWCLWIQLCNNLGERFCAYNLP